MPTESDTMRSTTLESKVNENTAAAERLMTPAIVVVMIMETSVALMANPVSESAPFKHTHP